MARIRRYLLLSLFSGLLILAAGGCRGTSEKSPQAPQKPQPGQNPAAPASAGSSVGLLYPDGESGLLTLYSDKLPLKGDPVQDMAAILNRYLSGPALSSQWLPFPQGCKLRSLYELDPHTVVVDLTGPVSSGGGSTVEMARVYGIIDTLHWNFPKISVVQILVDGRQVQTLLGHVDVSKPLPADPLMVEQRLRAKFASLGS